MNAEQFKADISLSFAQSAYSALSHSPEKRGQQTVDDYANCLAGDYAHLCKIVESKPELRETMEAEFARYREGYKQRTMDWLRSKSRCASWFITGPANFPVRRMEKRQNVEHKRLEELIEFRKRAMAAITKTLCPELRPIMAGDSDAVQALEAKIAEAEKLQEQMREGNKLVRKFKGDVPAGVAALVALLGCKESTASKLFEPDFCGRIGFADYQLTNNSANIRRMQQRLACLKIAKATPAAEKQSENGIRLEDCPADNRVRLFFPGKPPEEVRSKLKSNGFRWSPTIGAWQAYRNGNSMQIASQMIGGVGCA